MPGNWDIRNEYADFTGKGWYRTVFNSPAGIAGKTVRLNFEAVGINYKVWLNDQLIVKNGKIPGLSILHPNLQFTITLPLLV